MARLLWLLALLVGCGDDGAPAADAGIVFDAAPDPGPSAPVLVPCPDGWREGATGGGVPICEPWPEGGRVDCSGAEAHLPGTPGCATLGAPCPPGEFPEDLPADGLVFYVSAGASGGDGSLASPYGRLSAVNLRAAPAGTTVVLGRGEHDGLAQVGAGVTLRGTCASGTRLFTSITTATTPVIRLAGAGATARDLTISDVPVSAVAVLAGAEGRLSGVVVERTGASAVYVQTGATADVDGLIVRDPRPVAGSPAADTFASGGTATVRRASFEGATIWSVLSLGAEAHLDLADAVVRDTGGIAVGARTHSSVNVTEQGSATLSRLAVEDSTTIGIQVTLDGHATLEDVVIHRVRSDPTLRIGGTGMWVGEGGVAETRRVDIAQTREVAVLMTLDATLTASDTIIRDTRGNERDGEFGYGLELTGPGHIVADRLLLEDNHGAGLALFHADALAELRDLSITGTAAQECVVAGCPDSPGGHGMLVSGAYADISSFAVTRSNLCGVLLSGDVELDLHRGVISSGEIGICLQVEGYDVSRLQDGVRFEDNGTNLDATSLPVPDPATPFGA